MIRHLEYDMIIVGAGIAGLSVARAANSAGIKTAVIEKRRPGAGASGAPRALLNPATGRKAKKSWQAEKSLTCTRTLLETVQESAGTRFFANNGVVRPAQDLKMAENMHREYRKSSWPPGWIEWLEEEELQREFPGLNCHGGGLWIPAGGTVSLELFMHSFYHYLKNNGVNFHLGEGMVFSEESPWTAAGADVHLTSRHIVHATGREMTGHPLWSMLSLEQVKGQTLAVQTTRPLPFRCSVSSLGYIAQNPDAKSSIVLGSTYEHHFSHLKPDAEGSEYLLERLERTFPGIREQITDRKGWAGVRVTTPDKQPFIGSHPDRENLYAIGGLGSKGLMFAPRLGEILIDYILSGKELPGLFSIDRLLNRDYKNSAI